MSTDWREEIDDDYDFLEDVDEDAPADPEVLEELGYDPDDEDDPDLDDLNDDDDEEEDDDIPEDALAKGTKHEMEHTDDPKVARKIALDHLRERPDYYDVIDEALKERIDHD